MGKVLGRAAPAALWDTATSSCHKLPNPKLIFVCGSRDMFRMSPHCPPHGVSYGGSVLAVPGLVQQTLGFRACPNHCLLFPAPAAIQIVYLGISI